MDKHYIYKKYESEFIGHFVVQHCKTNKKQLTKTDIHLLKRLTYRLWISKICTLEDSWINASASLYAINRRSAVKHMFAYLGNYWASYCNLNKKTGLLNISTDDYGHKNVCVGFCDAGLENITKQMYMDLEQLYTSKECA